MAWANNHVAGRTFESNMRRVVARLMLPMCWVIATSAFADQTIAPTADGTLVDGGGYGPFNGTADAADWFFNQSSYEGAITLSHDGDSSIEHRLVFEFNLSAISTPPPVVAGLRFKLRGAPRFPAETALVEVFAFPSDLAETLGDFSAGPAELVGQVSVAAFQPETLFEINISDQVNAALASASKRVAIRLQLTPSTQSAQAFLDAVDTDSATKPSIVLYSSLAGDFDHDGKLDVADLSFLISCMAGPGIRYGTGCSPCDFNGDLDVDLADLRSFQERHSTFGQ